MPLDPNTPVLVGAGVVQQRLDDPAAAHEPIELMFEALVRAGEDCGAPALLGRADRICVPRGFWSYRDPARLIAERFGAAGARTLVSEIGVLQTTLFARAAQAIASGHAAVALIAGGEARYRELRARLSHTPAPLREQASSVEPDERLTPAADLVSAAELANGLGMPVAQYSLIENALRHAEGRSVAEHRRELAELWARFSDVAADNPHAWRRERCSAEQIMNASEQNPMLAFPYTKLHNSQWNVDQAAGLLLCSLRTARAAGVPEARMVFPLALSESNFLLPLSERPDLARSIGFELSGARAFELADRDPAHVEHLELYSCFPSAVRLQARAFGIPLERRLTETGGMAFAGGPLNNFVLQAAQRMVEVLRADPGSTGLLSAISGYVSKQGVSLWSTQPPERGFAFEDTSEAVARRTKPCKVDPDYAGPATVASYALLYAGESPARGVLVCDIAPQLRTIVSSADPELLRDMAKEELCGRSVRIGRGPEGSARAIRLD